MSAMRLPKMLLTLLVISIFAVYFILNRTEFRPLLDVNASLLIAVAALNIFAIFVNGLFTKAILIPFKKHISITESFHVSLISSVGNFFAPAGAGFGLRAIYLKKKFGLAYSDFLSTLAGNYIIVFFVSSLAGLLSLWLLKDKQDSQYIVLLLVFLAIFAGSLTLSLVRIKIPTINTRNKLLGPVFRNLERVVNGWSSIVKDKMLMLRLTAITILNVSATTILIWAIISSLHLQITIGALLLFSVLSSLSLFINITPANLGVKEAVYLFSSGILGFSTTQILSIALIDRGVMFLVLAGLWAVSHKIKASFPEKLAK